MINMILDGEYAYIEDVNEAFKVLGEGKVARSVLTFD